MKLSEILLKHGIFLYEEDGSFRSPIDIIEDLYIRLTPFSFKALMKEIEEEEREANIFQNERNEYYADKN